MRKKISILFMTIILVLFNGCSRDIPKNSVFSAEDLDGKSIGVLSGSAAAVYTEGYDTVHFYSSSNGMLSDLKSGTLDCIVMDLSSAEMLIEKEPKVKILSEPFVSEAFSFVIAKENADLTEALNAALSELIDNGTLENIINGYIMDTGYTYESPEHIDRSAGMLTLAVDADFPPYEYIGDDGEIKGLDIDICRAVCDILGVELSVVSEESSNLITTVRFGKADFAMGHLVVDEIDAEIVDFSDSYTTSTQVIIVRKR